MGKATFLISLVVFLSSSCEQLVGKVPSSGLPMTDFRIGDRMVGKEVEYLAIGILLLFFLFTIVWFLIQWREWKAHHIKKKYAHPIFEGEFAGKIGSR